MRTFSAHIGEEKHGTEPCGFVLDGFSGPATFIARLWGIVRAVSCCVFLPECPGAYGKFDGGSPSLSRSKFKSALSESFIVYRPSCSSRYTKEARPLRSLTLQLLDPK
jgi:hypothetical protein